MNTVTDIKCMKDIYPKVVYYTASWCKPCKDVSPKIDKLADDNPSISFFKIDIDTLETHVSSMKIKSVPTFIFYKNVLSEPVIVTGANLSSIKKNVDDLL